MIGTRRVISVIDGRMKTSFLLDFFEVVIWLSDRFYPRAHRGKSVV